MTNPFGIDEDIIADLNTVLSGGKTDLNEIEIMNSLNDRIAKLVIAMELLPSLELRSIMLKRIIFKLLGNAFAAGVTVGKQQGQRDTVRKLN